jgi:hypothetical protein
MVNEPWKKFMFQEAQNWKTLEVPKEAKVHLTNNLANASRDISAHWFSLVDLKMLS